MERGHPYVPSSAPSVRDELLTAIGAGSVEELYAAIPERLRLRRPLELPAALPSEHAVEVWDALTKAGSAYGLRPAGLAARDTLRTEMGYPLHGQDLSPKITPLQARAGWAVGWSKPAFWGREALLA